MKTYLPLIAIALQMLATTETHAASGTINFTGSIVEGAQCQVSEFSTTTSVKPRVMCLTPEGNFKTATQSEIHVSMSELNTTPITSTSLNVTHLYRVVTLEYR